MFQDLSCGLASPHPTHAFTPADMINIQARMRTLQRPDLAELVADIQRHEQCRLEKVGLQSDDDLY